MSDVLTRYLARRVGLASSLPTVTDLTETRRQARWVSDTLFEEFGEPGPGCHVTDHVLRGVRVRLYRSSPDRLPLHVVFHGGGWTTGAVDEDVVEAACRERAVLAGCAVASVDYRLAPEHPFPAAVDDAYEAFLGLVAGADELGVDAGDISVGGSSAGANIAAALSLRCRDEGGARPSFQLLEVPALDLDVDLIEPRHFAEAPDLSGDDLRAAAACYAGGTPLDHPLLSPLRASPTGLPPTHVMTAGRDPLRFQGRSHAARLQAAGVPVTWSEHPEAIHGSGFLTREWEVARAWRTEVLEVLTRVHAPVASAVLGPPS